MPIQVRNAELVSLLSPDFQLRGEPNFAWVNAISAHLMLPGLRGFWPMSVVGDAGVAMDLSEQGRTLTNRGTTTYSSTGLAPYVEFDGNSDFLDRADETGLDIIGTEAYISHPGLTMGCWCYFDNDAGATEEMVMCKRCGNTVATLSYSLGRDTAGGGSDIHFTISDGVGFEWVFPPVPALGAAWYHIVGRWVPSAERSIFQDGVETMLASAIASLVNTTCDFVIGSRDTAAAGAHVYFMDGRVSLAFLCASALSDAAIFSIYQQTRALFAK